MTLAALVARRIVISLGLIALLVGITIAIFNAIPFEPGRIVVSNPRATPAQLEEADHALGVDRSVLRQYVDYLGRLARGDFGEAWGGARVDAKGELQGALVAPILGRSLKRTASLVLGGALVLLALAVPLGIITATRPNSIFDRTVLLVTLVAISTHPIVVAVLLQLAAVNELGIAPITAGYCPILSGHDDPCGGVAAWAHHLMLPWLSFSLFFAALYVRMIRAKMLDVLDEPYVRTARAKGAPERRVLGVHALRNAIAPVVTMLAMDMGTVLGIAVYVESVFRLGGLGSLAVFALGGGGGGYDLPLILGIVVVTAVIVITLNLLADVAAAVIDPRLKEQWAQGSAMRALRATP